MKRIVRFARLAAVISLAALTFSCSHKPQKALRVVQYNVGAFAKEIENSIPMISDMMKELGADVVSLNELDSCNRRHENYQLADFAKAMGDWNYSYSSSFSYQGGGYGVGVATKAEILDSFRIGLDKEDGSEYRSCSVVETPDYVLASTHLDHVSMTAQLHQAQTLTSVLVEKYGASRKPVILCGDMNAEPESETIKSLLQEWDLVSCTDLTYPADAPRKCIDYVFVLKNKAKYELSKTFVPMSFEKGDVAVASDHCPIFVELLISE
ncbi:MAG: endonuclease/exonuclease/phosphatase family protein [Bacteroidales bacterium]|nr:endonuclease/exonuclease/phosphatase family protein [Bacteroidales bacterium]